MIHRRASLPRAAAFLLKLMRVLEMGPEVAEVLNGQLWSEIKDDWDKERPLLAHYTSLEVLEDIVRNDEIWFSHPLLMNDHEEVLWGIDNGVAAFRQNDQLKRSIQRPLLEALVDGLEGERQKYLQHHLFDTYVFCLSRHDASDWQGRLSMWRGYGGNGSGAAVVFDTGKLDINENSPLILGEVHYLEASERIGWLTNLVDIVSKFVSGRLFSPDDMFHIAHLVFERIKVAAIFSKHCGFREEEEWRVVYMPERDIEGRLHSQLGHHNGRHGFEPKLKYKVAPVEGLTTPDFCLEKIVDRIILGPSRASPVARGAACRMLHDAKKGSLVDRLVSSPIPFRST